MAKSNSGTGAAGTGKTQNTSARDSAATPAPEFDWLLDAMEARAAEAAAPKAKGEGFAPPDGAAAPKPSPAATPAGRPSPTVVPAIEQDAGRPVTAYGLRKVQDGYETVRYTIQGELIAKEEVLHQAEPFQAVAYGYAEEELRSEYLRERQPNECRK